MSELYNRIETLCKKREITITEMCRMSGAPRGSLTDLKMGRTNGLNTATLQKLSEYFGVTVGYLLGTENKKDPATDNRSGISDARMKLLAALDGMSEDEVLAVIELAEAAKRLRGK